MLPMVGAVRVAALGLLVVALSRGPGVQAFLPATTHAASRTSLGASHQSLEPADGNDIHQNPQHSDDYHSSEFLNLEPLPPLSDRRKARLHHERIAQSQFVPFGDDLWELRDRMDQLSIQLLQGIKAALTQGQEQQRNTRRRSSPKDADRNHDDHDSGPGGRATAGELQDLEHIRQELRQAEARDPELVYQLSLVGAREATNEKERRKHVRKALAARSCLPQFQLDGLWVGKYGSHGYELINVTYVGDTLIATKVTGDRNVPRGEISFQVDLNPLRPKDVVLQPIVLSEKAIAKWNTKKLARYCGLGRVAEEGFQNHQWMDGQLIIIGKEYFSFAWIPIEQQIFFGRPSPELALKMLREQGVVPLRVSSSSAVATLDDHVDVQKEYVARCLEKTHEVFEDEMDVQLDDASAFGCIWGSSDSDECYLE